MTHNKRLSLSQNKSLIVMTSALILIVAFAVAGSGWTEGLNAIVFISGFSIISGLLISRSLLPSLIAHLFSFIIGAGWSFWVVSRMLPQQYNWPTRWQNMWDRIGVWYTYAIEGGVSYDNLMFILEMGVIVWGIGYLTMWFMFRAGKIWSAILPGGIVLLINLYYAPEDLTLWFLAYLLVSMLLIVRFNLMEHEQRWRADHVYFRSDIGFDFLRDGLIFSVLIITLAWFTPVIGEDYAVEAFGIMDREWRSVQNEWNRLFANLNYKPDPLRSANAFGQALTLGGARRLTSLPVMMVKAPGGRYWRASVYDEYTGQQWISNDQINIDMAGNKSPSSLPFYHARQPFTQTYTLFSNGVTVLYAMANVHSVSRNAVGKASHISPEQAVSGGQNYWTGKRQPWLEEITYIESYRRLKEQESYQAVSLISTASKEDLQSDTVSYPDWITSRYLQLPEGIPRRVFDLAEEITRDADTPYDKASAIETYLRTHISYNEGIAPPPPDRDRVDYVLFDLKEAYCDYYATSMIVMLRSQDIPARLAAGYAQGQLDTLDNQEQVYNVQNKDAHSWVEVFFPTYGWIDFEPTAAQPVILRRSAKKDEFIPPSDRLDTGPPEDFDRTDRLEEPDLSAEGELPDRLRIRLPFWGEVSAPKGVVTGVAVASMLLILAVGGWFFYAYRQKALETTIPTVNGVYFAMLKLAAWMGLKKRPEQTAYEHAGQLESAIPVIESEVELITTEFVHQQYSQNYATPNDLKTQIFKAWNNVRPLLYRAVFKRRNPLRKIRLPFKR